MLDDVAKRELAWIEAQGTEDSEDDYVVSSNYQFERFHDILDEVTRIRFVEAQAAALSRARTTIDTAYDLYKTAINSDQHFWTAGEAISLEQLLMMVKHGRTLYCEQWSFLSALPEDPDDVTVRSAVEDSAVGSSESTEHKALRIGAEMAEALRDSVSNDRFRLRINNDLIAAGLGPLRPEEARTWDSHKQHHDSMVADGYIPIWWVTTATALASEMDAIDPARANERAKIAATALGLSLARPGPYYAVEIPGGSAGGHMVYKPTVLCGGFPENFCAVAPRDLPGSTARLATGERGLIEGVMVPVDPRSSGPWRVVYYLGTIGEQLPPANTKRIRERLGIGAGE